MHSRVGWKIYWHNLGQTHVRSNLEGTLVMLSSELTLKVIIAGDGGVGKTTLLRKFVSGSFNPATSMTIGVQFHAKRVEYDGQPVSLQLWDLGGQDHFRFILPSYTSGAKGALLLYDMTRPSTLDTLREWVKICRTYNKDLPILFCGTKADLVGSRRISAAYARTFLEPLDLVAHIEVSARTGVNVERAFEMIVARMVRSKNPMTLR